MRDRDPSEISITPEVFAGAVAIKFGYDDDRVSFGRANRKINPSPKIRKFPPKFALLKKYDLVLSYYSHEMLAEDLGFDTKETVLGDAQEREGRIHLSYTDGQGRRIDFAQNQLQETFKIKFGSGDLAKLTRLLEAKIELFLKEERAKIAE